MAEYLLRLVEARKSFGSVEVLRGVSLDVAAGEVVGVVGDNGAGKSTLMKCITGVYRLDSGEIWFAGQRRTVVHPRESRALGIEMIYQDLALAGRQDVASNIFLGREPLWKAPGLPISLIDFEPHGTRRRGDHSSAGGSNCLGPLADRSIVRRPATERRDRTRPDLPATAGHNGRAHCCARRARSQPRPGIDPRAETAGHSRDSHQPSPYRYLRGVGPNSSHCAKARSSPPKRSPTLR